MNFFTVWARGQNAHWVQAGKLEFGSGGFAFRYVEHWLAASWAYSLDPVHLPLAPAIYYAANQQELLPLFKQLLPQGWAADLCNARAKSSLNTTLLKQFKYLPEGLSNIRLSLGESPLNELSLPSWEDMELYCQMVREQNSHDWPIARYLALLCGGCWQGSRPKLTFQGAPNLWLAKWQMPGEKINWPQVEYACMELLQQAGFTVPARHLIPIQSSHWIYLIERFEQSKHEPCYFVPASVLLTPKQFITADDDARQDPSSYIAFARCLRKYSSRAKNDLLDLFRRMLANLILNNTQDHPYKLGLIYNIKNQQWHLSPYFGVRPCLEVSEHQSMGIGVKGRLRTINNALSLSKEFGLTRTQAQTVLIQLQDSLAQWNEVFEHCGVSTAERQSVSSVVRLHDF